MGRVLRCSNDPSRSSTLVSAVWSGLQGSSRPGRCWVEVDVVLTVAMVSRPLSMEASTALCKKHKIWRWCTQGHASTQPSKFWKKKQSSIGDGKVMQRSSYLINGELSVGVLQWSFGHEWMMKDFYRKQGTIMDVVLITNDLWNSKGYSLSRGNLSLGFFFRRQPMRCLTSSDRWSGSSKSALITLFRVLFTPSVSKGGRPTTSVYSMQPTDHTSASRPCALLVAISLGWSRVGVRHWRGDDWGKVARVGRLTGRCN